jgi:hypothetical protein
MNEEKIEVVPIHPAFPALEVFENNEEPRFRPGINFLRHKFLLAGEFGSLQHSADQEHKDVVRFATNCGRHVRAVF